MGIRKNLLDKAIEAEFQSILAAWASRDAMQPLTEEERRAARLAAGERSMKWLLGECGGAGDPEPEPTA